MIWFEILLTGYALALVVGAWTLYRLGRTGRIDW